MPSTTSPARCEHCCGAMPLVQRRHARYCSGRCRTAACRARRVLPAEMTRRPRWVRCSARKVPLQVYAPRLAASSTDPCTWARYRDAAASSAGVGLGFVLFEPDGIVCIDLDKVVLPNGDLVPWARVLVDRLPETFVEVSMSGRGLHIWGRGHVKHGRRIEMPGGTGLEVYGDSRFIATTGRRFEDAPAVLADLTEVLAELL